MLPAIVFVWKFEGCAFTCADWCGLVCHHMSCEMAPDLSRLYVGKRVTSSSGSQKEVSSVKCQCMKLPLKWLTDMHRGIDFRNTLEEPLKEKGTANDIEQ